MRSEREKWSRIKVGENHFIEVRPLDPKILAQMPPPGSKPFTQISSIEFAINGIKKLLVPQK